MNRARAHEDLDWLTANRSYHYPKPFPTPAKAEASYDHINPSHYRGDRKFEPIAVIEDWGLNYHLGNAVKYIARNGRKPGEDPRQGLSKAIWYLERELERLGSNDEELPFEDTKLDNWTDGLWGGTPESVMPGLDDDYITFGIGEDVVNFSGALFSEEKPEFAGNYEGPLYAKHPELKKKDLSQFKSNEIVRSVIHPDGSITGTRKDGSTTVLRHAPGTYEAMVELDTYPSELEL